jgi:hypothetical protein
MDTGKKIFLEAIAQSLEKQERREWAHKQIRTPLHASEAQQKVVAALKGQLQPKPSSKDVSAKLYEGLLSLDTYFENIPPTENQIQTVIEKSQSDYRAFQALRAFAFLKVSPNSPTIKNWQDSLQLGLLTEPKMPRGPSPFGNAHRNMLIISQIKQLEALGWDPTQNNATKGNNSGCGIVAAAMSELGHTMTYEAVENVWKKRNEFVKLAYLKTLTEHALQSAINPDNEISD